MGNVIYNHNSSLAISKTGHNKASGNDMKFVFIDFEIIDNIKGDEPPFENGGDR